MTESVAAHPGSVTGRTVVGAGWLVAWRIVTRAIGLASTLVLARILVPADFGLVAMATAFSASVGALSELGVSDALVRRQENERGHYDTAFTMQLLRGLLTGTVIAAGAWSAADWFNEPRLLPVMFLLALFAVMGGCENIGIVDFRRYLRLDMEFKLLLLPRLAGFISTIVAALLLRSFWALLIGIALTYSFRLVMTYVMHPFRPRLTLSHWRDLVGFSFWAWLTSLVLILWERLDTFVLGPVFGPAKLGVYMLASELAVMPISELVAPAASALYPGMSAAQNRGTDLVGMAIGVVTAMLLVVVPLTIGVSATSGYIVAALLGPNWEEARPLISIFVWLCVLSPFSWVAMTVLKALGAMPQHFLVMVLATMFKAAVLYAVVQGGGQMEMAAFASIACVAVESALFLIQLRRLGDLRWRDSAGGLVRIVASTLFAVGVLSLTGLGWHPVSMGPLEALLVGGLTGLGAILLFLGAQFGLWWALGRPQGPEHRLLGLAVEGLTSWRLSRARTAPARQD